MITDNAAAPSQPPRIVGIKLQSPLKSFHFFFFGESIPFNLSATFIFINEAKEHMD